MDWTWIVAAVALGLAVAVALLSRGAAQTRAVAQRTRAAAQRGHHGEADAVAGLEARGFTVLEHHPIARYDLVVDDEPRRVRMSADYLVERDGAQWIVEVKTGARAKPTDRLTRRQLLEYALHYPVAGVFLYVPDKDALFRVDFPEFTPPPPLDPPSPRKWLAGAALVGIALGFGLGRLVH